MRSWPRVFILVAPQTIIYHSTTWGLRVGIRLQDSLGQTNCHTDTNILGSQCWWSKIIFKFNKPLKTQSCTSQCNSSILEKLNWLHKLIKLLFRSTDSSPILLFFQWLSPFLYILRCAKSPGVIKYKATEAAGCEKARAQWDLQCRWNWPLLPHLSASVKSATRKQSKFKRKYYKRQLCTLPSLIQKTHFPMISWTAKQSALFLPLSLWWCG